MRTEKAVALGRRQEASGCGHATRGYVAKRRDDRAAATGRRPNGLSTSLGIHAPPGRFVGACASSSSGEIRLVMRRAASNEHKRSSSTSPFAATTDRPVSHLAAATAHQRRDCKRLFESLPRCPQATQSDLTERLRVCPLMRLIQLCFSTIASSASVAAPLPFPGAIFLSRVRPRAPS